MAETLVPDGVKRGSSEDLHLERFWQIYYFNSGRGSMTVDDKNYSYMPGTIICVPPNTLHAAYSDVEFVYYRIELRTSMLPTDKTTVFMDDHHHSFKSLVSIYARMLRDKPLNYVNVAMSLRISMQHLLISWMNKRLTSEMIDLAEILQENISNAEFSITEAFECIPMSPDYIRKQFKQAYSVTPLTYLNQLRVNKAIGYLIGEERSMKEIASECGFSNAKYFSRVFHNLTGYTPNDYRVFFKKRRKDLNEKEELI